MFEIFKRQRLLPIKYVGPTYICALSPQSCILISAVESNIYISRRRIVIYRVQKHLCNKVVYFYHHIRRQVRTEKSANIAPIS